jgi:MFS family permease
VWLWARLQRRPAPVRESGAEPGTLWQDAADGLRLIRRSPRLLAIVGVLWVATLFTYAVEGVAAPWVDEFGRGVSALGVLLAANPLGVVVGGLVIARLVPPAKRERLVVPLVVLSLVAVGVAGVVGLLLGSGTVPFGLVVGLLFVSGIGAAWLIPLNVSFVQAVPSAFRGRAFGVAVSGLYGVQALGALGAGLAAERISPSGAVALSGVLGLIVVAPILLAFRRTQGSVAAVPAGEGPSEA